MSKAVRDPLYRRHRFPAEVIAHAVWLYFLFPLSLRMVEGHAGGSRHHRHASDYSELVGEIRPAFRPGDQTTVSRRRGDKWHLDECVVAINGRKQWLWRAVDQDGFVLDVLVQSRRNARAAKRLMRKLLTVQDHAPRVMITAAQVL